MIYVCVPTHNESRTVGVLLWKVSQVLKTLGRDFELLLLDDASTDSTQQVLEPYRRVLPITILRHAERQGYAVSLETLLRLAVSRSAYPKRDIIVTVQADFTEELDDILALIKRIEAGADVVAASVALPEATRRTDRWTHRAASYLAKRFGIGEEGPEALATLRAYRIFPVKKAIEAAAGKQIVHGGSWTANAQLLRAVRPFGRRIDVIPSTLHPERRQRTSRFSGWPALKQVFHLRGAVATPAFRHDLAVVQARSAPGLGLATGSSANRERGPRPASSGSGRGQRQGEPERTRRERPARPTRPPRRNGAATASAEAEVAPPRRSKAASSAPRPVEPPTEMLEATEVVAPPPVEGSAEAPPKTRRRRGARRRGRKREDTLQDQPQASEDGPSAPGEGTLERPPEGGEAPAAEATTPTEGTKRRRRRGGRRRRKPDTGAGQTELTLPGDTAATGNDNHGPSAAPEDSGTSAAG
jgi:hypothetical protein